MAAKFNSSLQEQFLQHLREGMRRGAAADTVGIGRQTVRVYIDEHPDFEKRVLDAELDATEHVEEALYQAAVSGNVAAARAWLELRAGGRPVAARAPSGGLTPPSPSRSDFDELDNVAVLDPRQRRRSS